MAIKVEVVSPVSSVSNVPGESTVITVINSTSSPITTNGSQAVVDVVGRFAVGNVIAQQENPTEPYEGMLWFSW